MNVPELYDIILPAAPPPVASGGTGALWLFLAMPMALIAGWMVLRALRGVRLVALQRAWRACVYDNRETIFLLADCLRRRFGINDLSDTPRFYRRGSTKRWDELVAHIDALRYREVAVSRDEMITLFREAQRLIVQSVRGRRC